MTTAEDDTLVVDNKFENYDNQKCLNMGSFLIHLSFLLKRDISQYARPFSPELVRNGDGIIRCSIEPKDENCKLIISAPPPSKIIEEKWSAAFIPLKPVLVTWRGDVLTTNLVEFESKNLILMQKSAAKREASLKRERDSDGSGKFKRCATKWVTAVDFYKPST